MLRLKNLSLKFDESQVIHNISFEVSEGELLCLLGPSGSGKTTTLRLIAGFEKPENGSIQLNGETVSTKNKILTPQKRNVGFLFQDYALFPHLTVAENISYGLSGQNKKQIKQQTWEMLSQIRLQDHADKYPHELSGGEQQRVALARARAPEPNLLLLDEPFSGLDTSLRAQLRLETREILKSQGVTAIIVTHDPEEAMLMADRIVLMRNGNVVQTGTPEELYSKPADPFTAGFFGDVNWLTGVVEGDWIKTDAGRVPNENYTDGTEVDVLIRPEAFEFGSNELDTDYLQDFRVCTVDYAGPFSHIQLGIGIDPEPSKHVQAHHQGILNASIGDKIRLSIDPAQTFIFPKTLNNN